MKKMPAKISHEKFGSQSYHWSCYHGDLQKLDDTPRGDLVVQGDVPVAKFRVSNFAIYYLLGSKNFQIYHSVGL